MSEAEGFKDALLAMVDYYEIYFFLIPVSGLVLLFFDGKSKELSLPQRVGAELYNILILSAVSYVFDKFHRVGPDAGMKYIASIGIRFLAVLAIGYIFCKFTLYILEKEHVTQISNFFKSKKIGILVFVFFMISLLLQMEGHMNPWASVWYVISYKDGVASRLFVGTMLSILRGDGFLSENFLLAVFLIAYVLIIVIISVLFNKYINGVNQQTKTSACFMLLLYLVFPCSIKFLWTKENMGRVETFVILFLFTAVLLYHKIKNKNIRFLVMSIFTIICMAVYQAYLFLYFPILFTLLCCDADVYPDTIEGNNKKPSSVNSSPDKLTIVWIIIVCLCTALSFFVFQFYSNINYASAEEMAEILSGRTDMEIDKTALYCELFGSVTESWRSFFEVMIVPGNTEYLRELGYINLVLLSPVLFLFLLGWTYLFRYSADGLNSFKGLLSNRYLWLLASDMLILIQFVLTMDWGRWFAAMMTVQCFQFMYLHYVGDKGMLKFMAKLNDFVEKHKVICAFLIIYLCILSPMQAAIQTDDSRRILRNIVKALQGLPLQ